MRSLEQVDGVEEDECFSIAESMIDEIEAFDNPKAGRSKGYAKRSLLRKVRMARQMGQSLG